jgi:hypothetical protein
MKIAILFYGRLNKFREHKDNILNAVGNDNDIDIFLSCSNEPDNIVAEFIDLYKPVDVLNQSIILPITLLQAIENKNRKNGIINNIILHFMNKSNVFKLLLNYINKTGIKYDIVISLRLDLLLDDKFNFSNFINNNNFIYIPEGNDWEGGINDQIAYGNIEAMKKYMFIFNNMIYLLNNKNNVIHPERLTRENIYHNNLNMIRFNLKYTIDK